MKKTLLLKLAKKIYARAEDDTDRTNEDGKASSVHFLHFDFNDSEINLFKDPKSEISLGFDHESYQHLTILSLEIKNSLKQDFES